MKNGWKFALVCGLLIVASVIFVRFSNNPPNRQMAQPVAPADSGDPAGTIASESSSGSAAVSKEEAAIDNRKALADALGVPVEEIVTVGGVDRPRRDIESSASDSSDNTSDDPADAPSVASVAPFARIGVAPRLRGDENAEVAGLMAELNSPEGARSAKSTLFAPEEFDVPSYRANPAEYLTRIRPARVFYPAQPGPEVKPIATESRSFQQVLQGEKVILRVKADPGMPVVFYTPQVGQFDNLLSSYTVAAGEDGIATATWLATTGSYGLNDILAASPVHSGQLQFRVKVELPDGPQVGDR